MLPDEISKRSAIILVEESYRVDENHLPVLAEDPVRQLNEQNVNCHISHGR